MDEERGEHIIPIRREPCDVWKTEMKAEMATIWRKESLWQRLAKQIRGLSPEQGEQDFESVIHGEQPQTGAGPTSAKRDETPILSISKSDEVLGNSQSIYRCFMHQLLKCLKATSTESRSEGNRKRQACQEEIISAVKSEWAIRHPWLQWHAYSIFGQSMED